MAVNIITIEDLLSFKAELLQHITELLSTTSHPSNKKWLRSKEVRKLLNISPGTLQTFRTNGTISYTKIGNLLYYSQDNINKILEGK